MSYAVWHKMEQEVIMADETGGQTAEEGTGSGSIPPYIPFQTLLTFLKDLKVNGLPPQIDKSVMTKLSGGTQGQLKVALRSLGLMKDNKPTDDMEAIVNALETPEFEPVLLKLLQRTYPYIFALDLMNATPSMFADAFKATGAKEDVSRKCRTFFLHAAKRAGVPLGNRILTGSVPRAPSAGARRKPKAAKAAADDANTQKQDVAGAKLKDERKSGKDHPLVDGLLITLPTPGKKWDVDARVSWLRMAAFIFENIYEGKGSIKIETERETATSQ